jgi:hypothetical protein
VPDSSLVGLPRTWRLAPEATIILDGRDFPIECVELVRVDELDPLQTRIGQMGVVGGGTVRARVRLFGRLFLIALGVLMLSSACRRGSDSDTTAGSSPEESDLVERADVEECLTQAGLQIDTGTDMPKLSGVVGIGVRSSAGGGQFLPRNQEAAVFVYPSEEAAKNANLGSFGIGSVETRLGGNVVVAFAPKPSPEFLDAVGACTFGLRSP